MSAAVRHAILPGLAVVLGAGAVAASEIGALHLAYEKPVRMRRIEATLYLSYPFDLSTPADGAGEAREVACAATPAGAGGRLPATGTMRLRLLGDGPMAPWQSGAIARRLDDRGEARFAAAEIETLASAAPDDGGGIELFELVLTGGKGKKVATMTIDCVQQPVAQ